MEVMGNGMTAALAFDKACDEIMLGRADVTLALGINMESAVSAAEHMMSSMRTTGDVDFHTSAGFTPIAWYAMDAMRYMHEHGATREQLGSVAVKNRFHASLNPLAQFRKPVTLEDVVAQRPIVEPLGLYDVPPRGDGAACLVLATEEVARSLGRPYVLVRGRGFYHDGTHQISDVPNDMIAFTAAREASRTAYEQAGISAEDLSLAELYAPCTIVEVLVSEAIGICQRVKEPVPHSMVKRAWEGAFNLHVRWTDISWTSCIRDFALQLRGVGGSTAGARRRAAGQNAQFGLGTGELGNYNAALIHILEAKS